MNTRSSVDRESFQKLLASAFAVQESGMDTRALSEVLKLQRTVAAGQLDLERTMREVAERARSVANAAGIAIAFLKGNQLVYRAGSGCAAGYVGRHVTATLSASPDKETRGEILRVENAETDTRIEAAICRQFDAQSLLILPVFRERKVAGVMEVLFREPHVFQDRELRAYRLMAGLVEELLPSEVKREQKSVRAPQTVSVAPASAVAPQSQMVRTEQTPPARVEGKQQPVHFFGTATALAWELSARREGKAVTKIMQHVRRVPLSRLQIRVPLERLRLRVAVPALVTLVLIGACWIAFGRRPATALRTPAVREADAARQPASLVPEISPPTNSATALPPMAGRTGEAKAPRSAFRQVRVGPNEIDYVADDVTIRSFIPKTSPATKGRYKQVDIGKDVTVRYFGTKPAAVAQSEPVSNAVQSAERSLPVSK